jgi:acyl-CoA thioesterase
VAKAPGTAKDSATLADRVAHAMFERDSASRSLGMKLEATGPGYARLSMRVREDMVNGHSICHGGLVFTLADSAFAFACNSSNRATVAASGQIEFLIPAELGDVLTATAREHWRSRRAGIYDVLVENQAGTRVALFRGRSHELGHPVVEDAGHP